ncbi:DUF6415 family natural product biosynthesis protein [Streptomyces sp. MMS24-I2-30]|uniref:DUF6415 family natural product biosynthesis protein n=1 Tax=Streptomyces sp. MMS24-I2-30 TaxID=3351564 RepID=UPI003896860E
MTDSRPDRAQLAPIDADTIHRTCETVLWGTVPHPSDDVADQLLGHVRQLLPEVRGLVRRRTCRGEQERTALHVIRRTRRTLRATGSPPDANDLWGLATYCRALLAMYQQLRPLDDWPAHGGRADGGRR